MSKKQSSKAALVVIICSLLAISSFSQPSRQKLIQDIQAKQKAAIGKPFPSFSVKDGDSLFTNAALKGKLVYINFWFEACTPCIAEFEGLNKLYDTLKGRPDFEFVSFTFETEERVKALRQKYNLKYRIVSLQKDVCHRLNQGSGFPTHIILDKDHKITHFSAGGNSNKQRATEHIMNYFYPEILEGLSPPL
jgi:peroxiredoxin